MKLMEIFESEEVAHEEFSIKVMGGKFASAILLWGMTLSLDEEVGDPRIFKIDGESAQELSGSLGMKLIMEFSSIIHQIQDFLSKLYSGKINTIINISEIEKERWNKWEKDLKEHKKNLNNVRNFESHYYSTKMLGNLKKTKKWIEEKEIKEETEFDSLKILIYSLFRIDIEKDQEEARKVFKCNSLILDFYIEYLKKFRKANMERVEEKSIKKFNEGMEVFEKISWALADISGDYDNYVQDLKKEMNKNED